ncbi:MAG TPA: Xaa-Pro peptidase family protein [Vicinamibacterales bacterium]
MTVGAAHRFVLILVLVAVAAVPPAAQPVLFTDAFPPEEFAARRDRVFDAIGDGIAVLQGAAEYPGYIHFRQNNHFFYLTGVEVPRALLLLDGRARRATLFLPERDEALERSEGPRLVPGAEAERLTGIPRVLPRSAFARALQAAAAPGRTLFVPHRAESLGAATPYAAARHAELSAADPWDGRVSRAAQFIRALRAAAPGVDIEDLDPVLDRLRVIKSPREIAHIREATRLAGEGVLAVMRRARPGMREYELEAIADYVFRSGGAQGFAYFALVATGPNAWYPHYHGRLGTLRAGDLVLFDYGPDYHYYTADVTRMFPASGRFTAEQRELYSAYVRLYRELMASIGPGRAPGAVVQAAASGMARALERTAFRSSRNRAAAAAFVDAMRQAPFWTLGHMVGMEVHDVQPPVERFEPGMVFTIEPALTIPDERVYIRLEDVILITPQGYENLSAFVPIDADAIEQLMSARETENGK